MTGKTEGKTYEKFKFFLSSQIFGYQNFAEKTLARLKLSFHG